MFDSKSLGLGSRGPQPKPRGGPSATDGSRAVSRDLSVPIQAGPAPTSEDRSLGLLRQLRNRWVELLDSPSSAQVAMEAGAYMSRIAGSPRIEARQIRLLQQMNEGKARPALGPEGKPVLHDPQSALKHIELQIKSLSARCSSEVRPGEQQITRASLQVFGAHQPMNSGTYQGVQTEPKLQRETEARTELLSSKPEPRTATATSVAQGELRPLNQNRTTVRTLPQAEPTRSPEVRSTAVAREPARPPEVRSPEVRSTAVAREPARPPEVRSPEVRSTAVARERAPGPGVRSPEVRSTAVAREPAGPPEVRSPETPSVPPKPEVGAQRVPPKPPETPIEISKPAPGPPKPELKTELDLGPRPLPAELRPEGLAARLPVFKSLSPVTTVRTAAVEGQNSESRGNYPEWLQSRMSDEATPAYRTSMPLMPRSFKPFDSQPITSPAREAIDAASKTDYRRTDDIREQQARPQELASRSLASPVAAASGQLYQAVVSQGLLPSPRSTSESSGPKLQESSKKAVGDEEKAGSVGEVRGTSRGGVTGKILSQSPIDSLRGMAAALSGSTGRRDSDKTRQELPNLAAGWAAQETPENRLKNGRTVTAQVPMYSPFLDEMAERKKDSSKASSGREGSKTTEAGSQYTGRLQQVGEDSGRGGQRGGQQQQQREPSPGPAESPQQQQQQQRLQVEQRIHLQRLEGYRLAQATNALKMDSRMAQGPQGAQLGELVARNAGFSMEAMLKKAYRLDSLNELSQDEAVNCLGLVLKLGGEFTFAHSARVLELAMDLADEVGIQDEKTRNQVKLGALLKDTGEMAVLLDSAPQEKLDQMGEWLGSQDLRKAGLLHDIGKIKVPNEILYKPGKLTAEEYEIIKMHPIWGEQIVYPISSLRHLCPAIRGHHERWDGKGYPDGLKGEAIPLPARIIAVADVFDALAAERPYKAGMPVEKVQAILREGRGSHFDPDLADAFERVLQRRYPELDNPFA